MNDEMNKSLMEERKAVIGVLNEEALHDLEVPIALVETNQEKASTMRTIMVQTTRKSTVNYSKYFLQVDPEQDYRASEIKLCSARRPHMRAFHFAWWCYHVAFLMWFSITPLLKEVQNTLRIKDSDIWTSSIAASIGTIVMRFSLGPFCDKFGPRILMGIVLFCSACPTAMTGFVNSATGLTVLRFFIGIGGSTFVMCQYWTTRMFTREVVGTANATVAGWGNLGGGIAQIIVGTFLFPVLKAAYGGDTEKAWRTACIVPATLGMLTAFAVIKYSDDCPTGNYSALKKEKKMEDVNAVSSLKDGALNCNTWLLFIQYACCFGVEITMNNASALYFSDKFNLSTEKAAAAAAVFGWMNIFARGCGGFISDKMNSYFGMRGRLLWQSCVLLVEGALVITFAHAQTLSFSLGILIMFSIFVQLAEGSTYGIVPYINPKSTGSVSGIVGAGGNVGAVVFGLFFRELEAKNAFVCIGIAILCSSILSALVQIDGQVHFFLRNDERSSIKRLELIKSPDETIITASENTRSSSPISQDLVLHFPIGTDIVNDSDIVNQRFAQLNKN